MVLRSTLRDGLKVRMQSLGSRLLSITPVDDLRYIRWFGGRAALRKLLAKLDINCVIDVGANRGQYGLVLRQLGYRGLIASFEPLKENYRVLESVARQNRPWKVFPCALGALSGQLLINVARETVFSSFLKPTKESLRRFPNNLVVQTEEVEIRRLDEVFEQCVSELESPRVFLKMDTQGYDLEVLRGATCALERTLALQTEMSFQSIYFDMPTFVDSLRELLSRGFEVSDFVPVTYDAEELRVVEMDCLMVRSDHAARFEAVVRSVVVA